MAILKHISGDNTPRCYIGKILHYIRESYKTYDGQLCGTRGCCNDDPARDFYSLKKAFHKMDGKQGEHFVLSLETNNKADYKECMTVGYEIADYFSDFQIAFAVHKDTNNRHIHFVVNSVSYKDGHKFSQGPGELIEFKTYCNEILHKHNFDIVRMKTYEICDNELYSIYDGFGFLEKAVENTPKAEPEMNVIIPYDEDEIDDDWEENSWDLCDDDDDENDDNCDYDEYDYDIKKSKKSKKEKNKMSKKKSFVPEVVNSKLQLDNIDFSDKDMHIIAVDNSKNCNIKVKTKEQAAYLAGALFASANADEVIKDIGNSCLLANDGKAVRCLINNAKNLSIEIEDEE